MVVGMVIVAALGVGACSGDQKGGMAETETANPEDTSAPDSVWPGGDFAVSVALDLDDEVAVAREDEIDDRLVMYVFYFEKEPGNCLDDATRRIAAVHVGLNRDVVFAVPIGWTCAYACTAYDPIEVDPESGERFKIVCADMTTAVYVDRETDAWERMEIACYYVEVEGEPD